MKTTSLLACVGIIIVACIIGRATAAAQPNGASAAASRLTPAPQSREGITDLYARSFVKAILSDDVPLLDRLYKSGYVDLGKRIPYDGAPNDYYMEVAAQNCKFNAAKYMYNRQYGPLEDENSKAGPEEFDSSKYVRVTTGESLDYAFKANCFSVAQLLIDSGESVSNIQGNDRGETPLFLTMQDRNLAAFKFLLKNGADINEPVSSYRRDHILTILSGGPDSARPWMDAALAAPLDVTVTNDAGATAFDLLENGCSFYSKPVREASNYKRSSGPGKLSPQKLPGFSQPTLGHRLRCGSTFVGA